MTTRTTYWHLEGLGRKPTDYEIASSRLLYHPARGFETDLPLADWYLRHQKGSPFALPDPERFADPRRTTYTAYARIQNDQERATNALLEEMEAPAYDAALSPAWIGILGRTLAPLRYPLHGLQMAASYVGQMAPGGRIALAALFQTGDEIRRVHRMAYRMRQLQETRPGFGRDSKELWEKDPLWQPMRKLIERLLVAYDWGEAFVALNVVVKPLFDELFMTHFGELAARSGDPLLAKVLGSLHEDCLWHRDWTRTLLSQAILDQPDNRGVVRGWIRRWHAEALPAVAPFGTIFEGGATAVGSRFAAVMAQLHTMCRDYWSQCGLSMSPE